MHIIVNVFEWKEFKSIDFVMLFEIIVETRIKLKWLYYTPTLSWIFLSHKIKIYCLNLDQFNSME